MLYKEQLTSEVCTAIVHDPSMQATLARARDLARKEPNPDEASWKAAQTVRDELLRRIRVMPAGPISAIAQTALYAVNWRAVARVVIASKQQPQAN